MRNRVLRSIGVKRKKDEEAEKDITKQNTRFLVGFRNAYPPLRRL